MAAFFLFSDEQQQYSSSPPVMLDRDSIPTVSMNKISAGFLDQDLMNINNDATCSCCFNHTHDQFNHHQLPPSVLPLQGIIPASASSASASASSLENGTSHHQIQIMIKGKKQIKKCINGVKKKKMKMKEIDSSKEYVHVRARRGQATDSHSLAERVRRAKISGRMKQLQDLVPGCDKVIGKALMLEEIINYIQFLQYQVEFLSMKLASFNPMFYNMELEGITSSLMPNAQQYCNDNPNLYFVDSTSTTFTNQIMDNVFMDHDTGNNNLYPFQ